MTSKKEKQSSKQPKVGEAITEPLSAAEIAKRAEDEKLDNPVVETPPPAKPTKIFNKKKEKETKEETEAAEQVEANALAELKAQRTELSNVQGIAYAHARVAAQNGHTAHASNLKLIAEGISQLFKRKGDYLTPRARK
jgi:hypothetical protein